MAQNLDTHDRVTVTLSAHHQHVNTDPNSCTGRYSRFLSYIEDPYVRNVKATPAGVPLETGWLEHPAYVFIENRAGLHRSVNPTPEEKEDDLKQVVYLYMDEKSVNPIIIRPQGGFVFFETLDPSLCILKSMSGKDIPLAIKIFSR